MLESFCQEVIHVSIFLGITPPDQNNMSKYLFPNTSPDQMIEVNSGPLGPPETVIIGFLELFD